MDPTQRLCFGQEGERVRKATSALLRVSPQLAIALRRSMPFLANRCAEVAIGFVKAVPMGELLADLRAPFHATSLVASSGDRGALLLDASAFAAVLDGVLGGDGRSLPELDPDGLSAPQVAVLARVIDGAVRSLSDVFVREFGFDLRAAAAPEGNRADSEATPIACGFELGCGHPVGRVVLLLAEESLLGSSEKGESEAPVEDPVVARVLADVELDLVVELSRFRMTLGELSALKVGHTLRLEAAVGAAVLVRADGQVVLRGHPTTQAGQIAVRIEGRHAS